MLEHQCHFEHRRAGNGRAPVGTGPRAYNVLRHGRPGLPNPAALVAPREGPAAWRGG